MLYGEPPDWERGSTSTIGVAAVTMYELSKLFGAVVGAVLLLVVINEISKLLVHPTVPAKIAIAIEGIEEETEAATAAAKSTGPSVSLAALLATADPAEGEKAAKKCKSCHTVSNSGKHKIGPALWDIVGRKMASFKTYKYSKALRTKDRTWGYEELNAFLVNSQKFIKGTKMVFSGIKNTKDRANLILYLRSLSATPKPLPSNP